MARAVTGLLRDWLPALALMAVIFSLSSHSILPSPGDKTHDFVFKKSAHAVVYGTLALLYLRGVHRSRRPFLLAFLLTVAYAASDELHQATVPLRGASLGDVALDSLAGATMLLTVRAVVGRGRGLALAAARAVTGLRIE